ncbi:MAG TPA: DUF86 domain-containing protein [Methanocorpusculum sp.]|nr:DUF86 domain-containing protein [Methanocorpusculum sp.]
MRSCAFSDEVLVGHILNECRKILAITEKIDYGIFKKETLYQDGLIRPLEIIGEAAGNLSEEFCSNHPELPVREMRAMRNILAHQYYKVDIDYVWLAVTEEIPLVYKALLCV